MDCFDRCRKQKRRELWKTYTRSPRKLLGTVNIAECLVVAYQIYNLVLVLFGINQRINVKKKWIWNIYKVARLPRQIILGFLWEIWNISESQYLCKIYLQKTSYTWIILSIFVNKSRYYDPPFFLILNFLPHIIEFLNKNHFLFIWLWHFKTTLVNSNY